MKMVQFFDTPYKRNSLIWASPLQLGKVIKAMSLQNMNKLITQSDTVHTCGRF